VNLGGEQSGHIILSDYATTGDGLLAALQVLAELQVSQLPLSRLARLFDPYPQMLRNLRVARDAEDPLRRDAVRAAIAAAEARLGRDGRVVIRASGTEPVIRVMAEARDDALVRRTVDELCTVIGAVSA